MSTKLKRRESISTRYPDVYLKRSLGENTWRAKGSFASNREECARVYLEKLVALGIQYKNLADTKSLEQSLQTGLQY